MRTKTGIVTSNKMQNTIVVQVEYSQLHPIYKKAFSKRRKFYVHVPAGHDVDYKIGDSVTIYETTPISKTKRWTVVQPQQSEKQAA